jgi:hypothetical protein
VSHSSIHDFIKKLTTKKTDYEKLLAGSHSPDRHDTVSSLMAVTAPIGHLPLTGPIVVAFACLVRCFANLRSRLFRIRRGAKFFE